MTLLIHVWHIYTYIYIYCVLLCICVKNICIWMICFWYIFTIYLHACKSRGFSLFYVTHEKLLSDVWTFFYFSVFAHVGNKFTRSLVRWFVRWLVRSLHRTASVACPAPLLDRASRGRPVHDGSRWNDHKAVIYQQEVCAALLQADNHRTLTQGKCATSTTSCFSHVFKLARLAGHLAIIDWLPVIHLTTAQGAAAAAAI